MDGLDEGLLLSGQQEIEEIEEPERGLTDWESSDNEESWIWDDGGDDTELDADYMD